MVQLPLHLLRKWSKIKFQEKEMEIQGVEIGAGEESGNSVNLLGLLEGRYGAN